MRFVYFFVQAEDGIRDLVRSRGLGDVYKRQVLMQLFAHGHATHPDWTMAAGLVLAQLRAQMALPLSLIHI